MHLRRLERKDAPLMLEWMHDRDVIKDLNTDFASKTIDDCIAFIESSINDKENLHLSITDEADEYMGTVSLKHIEDQSAEFGIAIRTMAMGKGYSKKAMEEILNRGFGELGLKSVYWCVSPINQRAVRFYEKSGYQRVTPKVLKLSRGGVQRSTDSELLLVSGYKRRKGEQHLRGVALVQLNGMFPPYCVRFEKEEMK